MYIKRTSLLKSIGYLLEHFPCVVLLGARQVGKSTLIKEIDSSAHFFDLEKEQDFVRVHNDPQLLFKELKGRFIFDEAQLSPKLFAALSVEIDLQREKKGRFLLTGPSSPELLNNITETLAGRVAILEVPGLDWSESSQVPQSNLYQGLGSINELKALSPIHSHEQVLSYCLYGCFPEPFLQNKNQEFYDLCMKTT